MCGFLYSPKLASASVSMSLAKNRGKLDMEAHMVRVVSTWVLCGMLMSSRNLLLHNRDLHLAEINLSSVSRAHPIVSDISGLFHCFPNCWMSCFMEVLLYVWHQKEIVNWKKKKKLRTCVGPCRKYIMIKLKLQFRKSCQLGVTKDHFHFWITPIRKFQDSV